jgi:hypothetical protein
MAFSITESPLIITKTGMTSIDNTLLSPALGTNIRLSLSTDTTKYFVGTISKLNASILNANAGIYTSMLIEGVDNTGVKKAITLTIDNLINNTYGEYDKFYWTNNLGIDSTVVDEESSKSILNENASIQVFDTANTVKLGAVIAYSLDGGDNLIKGIINSISPQLDKITVQTIVANKPQTLALTLIQATSGVFVGSAINIEIPAMTFTEDSVIEDNTVLKDNAIFE